MKPFDLNLMRVLVAIYETRSVSAAADRLLLSQPTVSYDLGKLRGVYGDQLFVRGRGGMVATATGEELYARFCEALASVDATLESPLQFDPRVTSRRFRVSMSDLGAIYFVPHVLAFLRVEAPQAELEVVPFHKGVAEELALGRLDAVVANVPDAEDHTRSSLLFKEHHVCLVADNHPTIRETLTLEKFVSARHVRVLSPHIGHNLVDEALAALNIKRRTAVYIPQFTILPQLIATSDLLVTVPSRIAALFKKAGGVKAFEIPVPIPEYDVSVHWHVRSESNASRRWFISRLVETLSQP